MEVWKDIPEIEGYQVSNYGNVRSIDRYIEGGRWGHEFRRGRLLKPGVDTDGYLHVGLSIGTKTVTKKIHRLVMLAFHGPSDLVVNHKDSDRKNNRLENLEYVTHRENVAHSIKAGISKRIGQDNPNAKFSNSDVLNMRMLRKVGFTLKEIGEIYGLDPRNANRIIKGKQWAHL